MIGASIAKMYGGWNDGMTSLLIFMGVDYATGLLLAGVFHKSKKSESGALTSRACWEGLVKKGIALLIVLIGCRLDILIGTTYIRDTCVIGFCVAEALSIVENAGLMGVPIPNAITKAIEVLKQDENGEISEKPEA
ncbi:MAG: phage holin family protein [Bacteroidaceae bacterium]|nr:phage holin family protein [Bacteroidaceae bacterium]